LLNSDEQAAAATLSRALDSWLMDGQNRPRRSPAVAGEVGSSSLSIRFYNFIRLILSALPMTDTELKDIAAPAMIGLSNNPKNG
jgi:hypothetical protein